MDMAIHCMDRIPKSGLFGRLFPAARKRQGENRAMFDFLKQKREPPALPAGTVRRHFRVFGRVQGVGFRYRAKYAAQALELTGWVDNLDDGSVEMELQGQPDRIDRLLPMLRQNDYILITDILTHLVPVNPWDRDFVVRDFY